MDSRACLTRGRVGETGLDITVANSQGLAKYLAPTWQMVTDYKHGKITQEQYAMQYYKYLNRLKPHFFKYLAMSDRHFLCYCPNGTFCHTYLLIYYCIYKYSKWFTTDNQTKGIIEELRKATWTQS